MKSLVCIHIQVEAPTESSLRSLRTTGSCLASLLVSRLLPGGFATLSSSAMPEATSGRGRSKLRALSPPQKIDVKRELPVGSVSVFTLIRTDTTLDHSQKAEKV